MSKQAVERSGVQLISIVALLVGVTATLPVRPAVALQKIDPPDVGAVHCATDWHTYATLRIEGIHQENTIVRTHTVQIAASNVKLIFTSATCETVFHPLPQGAFAWQLTSRPFGSTTVLTGTTTLIANLTPDMAGKYEVRFIACPTGCSIGGATVDATPYNITLTAVDKLALPPGTEPVTPLQIATPPSQIPDWNARCQGGGGVAAPQWVTVYDWAGAEDYELLEGRVMYSRISRKDNELNHESQDHNAKIKPDIAYRRLLRGTQQDLEVEWERNHFPDIFWPAPGDRMSVFGYWILDCGHDGKTEIHPPVGIAVHRARPILIPSSEQFRLPGDPGGDDIVPPITDSVGSNVYVPGTITDIWFNRNSGEITSNCSTTGLHQPAYYVTTPEGSVLLEGDCISGPSPINRTFTFNVYLPPRPELTKAFDVPLYVKVVDHPYGFSGGPDPQVTLVRQLVPYLRVTIDLRNFTGAQYARRLYASWVLPSPDNWGLKRWKLRVNSLDVHNDADGKGRGDGDWRFWVATNNGTKEWTKLFDCDGCVHGLEDFDGRPWQTGSSAEVSADRNLGPDLLLFPNQDVWLHSSGFDEDSSLPSDDDTGTVSVLLLQQAYTNNSPSFCTPQTVSGCGSYTLNYRISEGAPPPPATLTSAAQRLLDDYVIGPLDTSAICWICISAGHEWYPYNATLAPGQQPISLSNTSLFRVQPSLEVHALTDISMADFTDVLLKTQANRPEKLDAVMKGLRQAVDEALYSPLRDEAILDIRLMQPSVPPDLWQKYFGDLKLQAMYLPKVQR